MTHPRLASKVRLVADRHEGGLVLVYPERGLVLGETAAAIAVRLDGSSTVAAIVDELVVLYGRDAREAITRDVDDFVASLEARGLLAWSETPRPRAALLSAGPRRERSTGAPRPFTLVAEVTHRCPLACPYCSNPLELVSREAELDEAGLSALLEQAEALGIVQVHFTGGEPLARRDLEALVARAHGLGLYVNLVTSGIPLSRERLEALARAGVDHVQVSVQASDATLADAIAGHPGHARKRDVLRWVKELGLPLTVNAVLHRENLHEVDALVALAEEASADRLELANVQYLAWALENRGALLPSAAQIEAAAVRAAHHKARLRGRMDVLFVKPDYFERTPKACMDGWARRFVHVAPDGLVLPCHAAAGLPGLAFERFDPGSGRSLRAIWEENEGMRAFRGDEWMPEPCRSCSERETDFGGCRCQAFALTGDARRTDPACSLSPDHGLLLRARQEADRAADSPTRIRWLHRGRAAPAR